MAILFDDGTALLNDIVIGVGDGTDLNTGTGDDIVLGGAGNDVLNGGAGNDMLLGLSGNNSLTGEAGSDTISGGSFSYISDGSTSTSTLTVTGDTNGIDTMSGGIGADHFVLGGNTTAGANSNLIIHYDELGNGDYALIQDFDSSQDTIELGGAKASYSLATSPSGLPSGTALYRGTELIAIIQGSTNLSISASYFNGSVG